MANTKNTVNIKQVFDDLDKYRDFCRDYGYRFNEADLYNTRSGNYKQFQRLLAGQKPRNQWEIDYTKYKEQEAAKVRG
jgi:hypothetical protein